MGSEGDVPLLASSLVALVVTPPVLSSPLVVVSVGLPDVMSLVLSNDVDVSPIGGPLSVGALGPQAKSEKTRARDGAW